MESESLEKINLSLCVLSDQTPTPYLTWLLSCFPVCLLPLCYALKLEVDHVLTSINWAYKPNVILATLISTQESWTCEALKWLAHWTYWGIFSSIACLLLLTAAEIYFNFSEILVVALSLKISCPLFIFLPGLLLNELDGWLCIWVCLQSRRIEYKEEIRGKYLTVY